MALFIWVLKKWNGGMLKEQSANDEGVALIVRVEQILFLAQINKALTFLVLFVSRQKEYKQLIINYLQIKIEASI